MNFWETAVRRVEKKYRVVYKRSPSNIAMFFAGIALVSWIGFLVLSGFPIVQYIYYTARPATSQKLAKVLSELKTEPERVVQAQEIPDNDGLPPEDVSLPEGHYLAIPSIGVDSVIWEAPTEEYEKAFRRGVWRVPDMAEPDSGKPVIIAAHRFGYLEWTNEYRRKNSFFNLPKMQAGDKFEILWDKRRYEYRVERVVEATEIDDYSSDIILYTCKFVVSPVRIFVYADRIN